MLGRSGSTAVAAAPLFGHCFSSNVQRRELSEQGVRMGVGKSSLPAAVNGSLMSTEINGSCSKHGVSLRVAI